MKILVVEDEEYKRVDVVACLKSLLPGAVISYADSFRGARAILVRQVFDLCVLDMNLPSFLKEPYSGARESDALAGRKLINFIEKTKLVKRVIVFTQYSTFSEHTEEIRYADLVELLTDECPRVFSGAIKYNVGDSSWKTGLEGLIKKIQNERSFGG